MGPSLKLKMTRNILSFSLQSECESLIRLRHELEDGFIETRETPVRL